MYLRRAPLFASFNLGLSYEAISNPKEHTPKNNTITHYILLIRHCNQYIQKSLQRTEKKKKDLIICNAFQLLGLMWARVCGMEQIDWLTSCHDEHAHWISEWGGYDTYHVSVTDALGAQLLMPSKV